MLLGRLEVKVEGDERPDSSAVPSLVSQAEAIRRLCFHSATPLVHVSRKRVWWSRDAHLNEDVWGGRWGGAPGVEGSRCTERWRRAVASWSVHKRPRGIVIMEEASRDAHLRYVMLESSLNNHIALYIL